MTQIGIGIGFGFGGGAAAPWSPASFGSDLYSWWRADLGITLNGGDVSAWADQTANAKHFSQGTAANQALYVASDSRFNGQPSVEFNGTSDFYMAGAAADWKFLHDGTSMSVLAVTHCPATTGARVLLDTCNASSVNIGLSMFFNNTTDTIACQVAAGGGVTAVLASGAEADAASHITAFTYAESFAPTEYDLRIDKASAASGNSSAAPSVSNPTGTLTLGRTSTSGTFFLRAAVAEIVIVRKRLSTAEIQLFETYCARYGM